MAWQVARIVSGGQSGVDRAAAPSPGTALTIDVARQLGRPCVVIDGGEGVVPALRDALTSLGATDGATLNVAGPRASEWATGYETTSRALDLLAAHGLVTIGHHRRRGRRWGSCGRCRWRRSGSWAQ